MSKINYDLSRIRALVFDIDGVLSPSMVPLGADGLPQRMANLKDGYAMQLALKSGLKLAIISGASQPSLANRFKIIGIESIYLGVAEKLPVFERWLRINGLEPEEVAYAGDDIPDIPVMRFCGLAVAPRDASVDAKAVASYITPCDGGHGVARCMIEEVLRAQGRWLNKDTAYAW